MNLSKTPRIASLKNKEEIRDIFSSSEKIRTKYGIIFLKRDTSDKILAGILIKKNTGNAVQRNYSKRIIRYFIRAHAQELETYSRIVFLYLYKGKTTYAKLESSYLKALKKYEQTTFNYH